MWWKGVKLWPKRVGEGLVWDIRSCEELYMRSVTGSSQRWHHVGWHSILPPVVGCIRVLVARLETCTQDHIRFMQCQPLSPKSKSCNDS